MIQYDYAEHCQYRENLYSKNRVCILGGNSRQAQPAHIKMAS
jgi:hypothetical protein